VLITIFSTIGIVALGWPVARGLGLPAPGALAVAMALSISSTAVVLRILDQKRQLHRQHGRLAFGVLLIQDLVALVILASVPLLASWAKGGVPAGAMTRRSPGLLGPTGIVAQACLSIGRIGLLIAIR